MFKVVSNKGQRVHSTQALKSKLLRNVIINTSEINKSRTQRTLHYITSLATRLYGYIVLAVLVVYTFHPDRHAKHYSYVDKYEILNELAKLKDIDTNRPPCVYNHIIIESKEIAIGDVYRKQDFKTPFKGGEYSPTDCQPLYKVAIIVPYRDREDQLNIFLNYMHAFLQNQNLHYRIFIVDQRNQSLFNRALLFNIGATEAISAGYPCLILHDVDLIPLVSGNMYACAKLPRHMSANIDIFRFNLMYEGIFGGAVAILATQFQRVNGMSNEYIGWGGEDDDFFERIRSEDMNTCRFDPDLTRYTMLKHKKQTPSPHRYKRLKKAKDRYKIDGLNSLMIRYSVIEKPLYTHLIVT